MFRFSKHHSKQFCIIASLLIVAFFVNCSSSYNYSYKKGKASNRYSKKDISFQTKPWRPSQKDSIPVVMNDRVQRWVKTFNGPLRSNFSRWIYRLGQYGPIIEPILVEENAPKDLIYLAMIESGFNLKAMSHASASGPWQFISSTGRMYGLNNDFFIDDRRNIVQSTRAAATHLKDLYKIYNDWYLAFAAYNAGPGKTNKAIRRGRSNNYWALTSRKSRLFRQETKDYVPKILAALHIVKNYQKYGYNTKSFGEPLEYEIATVPDSTDIHVIAQTTNTSADHIHELNPSLVMGITPPGKRFEICIPKGAKDEFKRNYAKIPPSERVTNLTYRVGYRETIASIAKKYHVSARELGRLNGIGSTNHRLNSGMVLKIPATKESLMAMASSGAYAGGSSGGTKVYYYRVRSGDTLSRIAKNNRTSVSKITKWNKLHSTSKLRVGQKIKIYKKSSGGTYAGGFFASRPQHEPKHISGVNHIITQDQQDPLPFTPTPTNYKNSNKNKVEVPVMVAVADDELTDEQDLPGVIKTLEEEQDEQDSPQFTQVQITKQYHRVKKGDTLSKIAAQYHINVRTLKSYNNLKSNNININQKLIVKKSQSQPTQVAANDNSTNDVSNAEPQTINSIYTVKRHDTLYTVAKKHRVYVSQIKNWNNLKSDKIKVGQKLKILNGTPSTTNVASNDPQQKVIVHKIKSGETLWSLSKKYGVKVRDIKKWNKLQTDRLKLNQKIKIIAEAKKPNQSA